MGELGVGEPRGCLSLGEVGWEDIPNEICGGCFIIGDIGGGSFTLGEVGPGDAGVDCSVGEVLLDVCSGGGSGLGTKMTEAKLSSESTLVSLCKLLSFEESEFSSRECRLSHSLLSSTSNF